MHGMICKSLEGYVISAHGKDVWAAIARDAEVGIDGFEAMQSYPNEVFAAAQTAAAKRLGRDRLQLMEDIGIWICTHPPLQPVRRLFRFIGTSFRDLVLSLDEVEARARMAVPELELPIFHLCQVDDVEFEVQCTWPIPGASGLLTGILRTLADEYGALAMIEIDATQKVSAGWVEIVSIQLFDEDFQAPQAFSLGGAA
ncbi:hypothetical protein JANAI62_00020 [Jannaschia pagri]|uniref:Heme NO-binding domain-containing protein n=1 Tax=Jannaschia pagri TaxID=2829797 RepID=A0ABQ4NG00_9RHOB|nr:MULTISPECIES: heme NO-binding domain-containing protein [unclassified Jannaschia]GIT90516.1 hypothetical protein JANAI61_09740 [Jannaschia sp. AI_61]GIT93379.1 hypothetical protein JANAI62_00020 [Jannaschia sp. AI_62]